MSLHSDLPYLIDMRNAARKVLSFTYGVKKGDFMANEEKHWAVMRGIEIVGEAATKVSDSEAFQSAHPDVAWKEMRGMRNILIHG